MNTRQIQRTDDNSWRVNIITNSIKYSGKIYARSGQDKRTISILNKPFKDPFVVDSRNIKLDKFITLYEVDMFHKKKKIGSYDNLEIDRESIILAYDEFEQMGDEVTRRQIRNNSNDMYKPQQIEIFTRPLGSSIYHLKGEIIKFQKQYQDKNTSFIPLTNTNLENIVSGTKEEHIPFLGLNKSVIQSYRVIE